MDNGECRNKRFDYYLIVEYFENGFKLLAQIAIFISG